MLAYHLCHHLLGLLLLVDTVLAGRYSFSVEEINVGVTRDLGEDDLVLVMALNANSTAVDQTWPLGSMKKNSHFKKNESFSLIREIEVPTGASNLSVAFAIVNVPDNNEEEAANMTKNVLEGVVSIAELAAGPVGVAAGIFGNLISLLSGSFDCSGLVANESVVYPKDQIDRLKQSEKICQTRNYTSDPPWGCGLGDSLYNATFCLERLDDPSVKPKASAGVTLLPGVFSSLQLAFFAIVMLYGGNGFLG